MDWKPRRRGNREWTIAAHSRNPLCYWCGKKTYLMRSGESVVGPLSATCDHVLPKKAKGRKPANYSDDSNKVLACYECNQRRNDREVAKKNLVKHHKRQYKGAQPSLALETYGR